MMKWKSNKCESFVQNHTAKLVVGLGFDSSSANSTNTYFPLLCYLVISLISGREARPRRLATAIFAHSAISEAILGAVLYSAPSCGSAPSP